jgi:hypothetical protein
MTERKHITHYDDCGCKSLRYEEEIASLQEALAAETKEKFLIDGANQRLHIMNTELTNQISDLDRTCDDQRDKLMRVIAHIQDCLDCDLCLEESDPKLKEELYKEWGKLGPDFRLMCARFVSEINDYDNKRVAAHVFMKRIRAFAREFEKETK